MGRLRFVAGALGLVIGFFLYEYGLLLMLNLWAPLLNWSAALLTWFGSAQATGVALQIAGGIVAIIGLLICIAWVGSQPRVELRRSELTPGRELGRGSVVLFARCKFCGATLESGATFCPKCQRSQV